MIIPQTGLAPHLIDMTTPEKAPCLSLERYRKEAYKIAVQSLYPREVKQKFLEAKSAIGIEMILLAAAKNI